MNIFTLNFDISKKIPLYKQLYNFIVNEIKSGNLKEDEKLPSKRALSSHLKISQKTIETSYEMLLAEGYIKSIPRSGFYVCCFENLKINPFNENLQSIEDNINEKIYKYDFRADKVDTSIFPYSTWTKISKEIIYNHSELLQHGHSQGDYCLRNSLTKYLHEFRGVNCIPEQIVIGAGMEYLISLITEILGKKSIFAFENPGYHKIYKIIKNNDRKINLINLDEAGMSINELINSNSNIAYITPSHQFPTGIIMPIVRRIDILKWANHKENRFIIEDDYNSEFKFNGKPIPSLQGLDKNNKVIYVGTFSKSIAPSIRVAYMVLPVDLIKIYNKDFSYYSSTVSRIEQHTIHRFIDGNFFERHLNRMRNVYKKRREFLILSIKNMSISNKIKFIGENSGFNILIKVENGMNEKTLIENAEEKGIKIYGLSHYYINKNVYMENNIIVLGYSDLDCNKIKEAVYLLDKAWSI